MNIERFTPSADPKMIPWGPGMWVRYDHAQVLDAEEAQIVRLMDPPSRVHASADESGFRRRQHRRSRVRRDEGRDRLRERLGRRNG